MSHLFGRAALAAVKKWKYEPRATADPDRRLQVRVQFKLEN
jgi:TonB family protein